MNVSGVIREIAAAAISPTTTVLIPENIEAIVLLFLNFS